MFSNRIASTSPTGRFRRSLNLGWVGRWTSRSFCECFESSSRWIAIQASLSWLRAGGHKCSFNISFLKAAKVPLRTAGVASFLASSISVLLAKGRSQCVMSMMWRKKWEMSETNTSPPCFWSAGKRPILPNIAQYVTILLYITETLHSNITVQDGIQLFQSGDIEHGQDVSIGRNYHFVSGSKEPFTIHLGFGAIKMKRTILCR